MKIVDVRLDTVCGYTSTLPEYDKPEIAFAGRSNVGKSSLINVLMKRKRLARVGETPGKTRTINFYFVSAETPDLGQIASGRTDAGPADGPGVVQAQDRCPSETESQALRISEGGAGLAPKKKLRWKKDPAKQGRGKAGSVSRQDLTKKIAVPRKPALPMAKREFYLVDLPGYGFAAVAESEKQKWGHMIENYLNSSKALRQVFLLVDIRHEPNANDIQMYDWIRESGFSPVIIATKADKISKSAVQRQAAVIRKGLGAPEDTAVIPFSALTGAGAPEIYRVIEKCL